ncbi:MAG TPA: tRNA (adenosine(37)-N6)-threonylcarbamoyltransferase complex dimerization subunit type 1 TsaB [Gammaproteobacteria bacterium]|nr:tRNA (adenosine(37)-N6)-threonylcarbamoyltransferase complex dimerization subunit type 1 TsaB [Gammaproteobacteria bacterium]
MNLLAFETSSTLGSVALETAAGLEVRELGIPREQTERLLRITDELLSAAGIEVRSLDGIAFGRGPGSFTGLRVSVAVAQGLGLASGVPLLPVSSLLCLAERAWQEVRCERALVCVDAHMGEVYWARAALRGDAVEIVGDERLGAPADVAPPEASPWCAVGNGFAAYSDALAGVTRAAAKVLPELKPWAAALLPRAKRDLKAGRATPPAAALPVYLREQTAWRRSS